MKFYNVQVIAISFIASILLQVAKSEFYTAIAELEKLLHTEGEIVKGLEQYLKIEEERLGKVKWLSEQYAKLHQAANHDVETFLSNPVNAYLLVKRLTADWETANTLIEGQDSRDVISNITYKSLNFPNNDDLSGAAAALMRLQEIYLLNTSTIARGEIKGTQMSSELTAGDCFELGRQAYQADEYNHSMHWMKEALNRLDNEKIETADRVEVVEYLAYTAYLLKNFTYALEVNDYLLELSPYHSRAHNNRNHYLQELEKEEEIKRAKGDMFEEPIIDDSLVDWEALGYLDPRIMTAYEKLCRGEHLKTPKEESLLNCFYTTNNNRYLLLQPVKVEVLNLKPRIVVYYDVIKESEADVIKALGTPKLARATVSNATTGKLEFANYRISKSAWLNNYEHRLIPKINRRVEDITGLDSETSEPLHVLNYGIGGHYEPHFDYAHPKDNITFIEGGRNRIATWIFYLSHVAAGGSTVFPTIGVEVKPIKGAAAFWYNLKRNGDGDTNTRHAACPVLAGSKWVANKWIHEAANEFRRKCSLDPLE